MFTSVYSKLFCLAHIRQFLYQEDALSKGKCSEMYYSVLRLTLESSGSQVVSNPLCLYSLPSSPTITAMSFFQVTSTALHQPAISEEARTAWSPAVPYLNCASVGMCDGAVGTGNFTPRRGLKHHSPVSKCQREGAAYLSQLPG